MLEIFRKLQWEGGNHTEFLNIQGVKAYFLGSGVPTELKWEAGPDLMGEGTNGTRT